MQVKEDGHIYALSNGEKLTFLKREEGKLVYEGTTNEEVLVVLINRMKWLQNKMPCKENALVITKLEESLMWLNDRTIKRVAQGVETKDIPHKD